MGAPIEGAVAALQQLSKEHRIIIHTVWAGNDQLRGAIANWLHYFDIPYDQITSMKPKADYYIDDHALHFETWEQVLTLI